MPAQLCQSGLELTCGLMERTRHAAWALAVNLLTGELFPHHPVMLQLDLGPFVVERDFLVEWNNLRVPAHYDCDIFNNGTAWGDYFYFSEQASRWTMCWNHFAELRSGLLANMVVLPVVDEEYNEMVATYQSVLRARAGQPYIYLDLGARWGTWGARAVRFLQARRPKLQYQLHLVESSPQSCQAIGEVMRKNSIAHTLQCGHATPSSFEAWAAGVDHVDMIDMDIQGAELLLLRGAMRTLKQKVCWQRSVRACRFVRSCRLHAFECVVRLSWMAHSHVYTAAPTRVLCAAGPTEYVSAAHEPD